MIVVIILGFLFGTVLGSFSKAMADRSLTEESFFTRSHCGKCKSSLNILDLFPVFSFLILRGRCRYCHKKIGNEYLGVEILTGVVVAILFWTFWNQYHNFQLDFTNIGGYYSLFVILSDIGLKLISISVLIMMFLTDIKQMLIPDRIIIPAIIISFFWVLISSAIKIGYLYYFLTLTRFGQLLLPPHSDYFYRHAIDITMPFFGGLLSGLGIAGFFISLIIITRGKGMGGGDVKLGAFMGMVLGFPGSLLALILSFITGAAFSIGLIILGKKHFGQTIPFGPFLSLGSLIAIFWGQEIFAWYLNLSLNLGLN